MNRKGQLAIQDMLSISRLNYYRLVVLVICRCQTMNKCTVVNNDSANDLTLKCEGRANVTPYTTTDHGLLQYHQISFRLYRRYFQWKPWPCL